jgi:DNA-directed RNA polymerase specialized sigma24 family protein
VTGSEEKNSVNPPADYEEFFLETYDRLRRMATFMLAGEIDQADELVENVLSTMLMSWGGIQDPQVHAVAVTAHRIAREPAPRQRRFPLLRRSRSAERAKVPSGPVVLEESPERLLPEQFAQLPAQQRVIAVLWWLYDWNQKDIAKALALKPRRVDKEIQRVEASLRRAFGLAGARAGVFDGLDGDRGTL